AEFLKKNTNAPYLIGPDGYVVTDARGKAQVWDPVTSSPRNYNDPNINDYPLTGDYNAFGVQCRPAFQIFKDKLKDYLPEKVSVITTISAETIRKVAKELVSAAEIGKTVQLEGQVYPLRQAAI